MINVAICDDDLIFATKIESMLIEICKKKMIAISIEVYSDGSELWNDIKSGKRYELFYLDIEMVRLNGIDVARKIRENDLNAVIIYISNYETYFIELFEVEPFRFMKKPINVELFESYFQKAYERICQRDAYFEYKFNKIIHKVPVKDIIYFESFGRVIKLIALGGEGKFYGKLNLLEKNLENRKMSFLRIHQSYLVNYKFIKEITFSKVVLFDGSQLQISEDRQKALRTKYSAVMRGEFLDG